MDNPSFNQSQSENETSLVVLSDSGMHDMLRNQRSAQHRVPEAKDFHNMSLMGTYGTHLLHNFPPQLLQSFNPTLLTNNSTTNFFTSERFIPKSMLSSFQFTSAFTPTKYIGIPIDQNLFNGCESFRTESSSPICTSQDSLETSNDYDCDKNGSPRSSNSEHKDSRKFHSSSKQSRSYFSDFCPVCGIQLTSDDWNSHYLTELDKLYKLSCGIERSSFVIDSYQIHDNAIRSKHNRWETFQRVQNNRQGRFKIKVRRRKYGRELFFMENLFCRSCPICRRKFSLDTDKEDEFKSHCENSTPVDEIDMDCECISGSNLELTKSNKTTEKENTVSNSNNAWDNMFNEKNKNELPTTTHHLYIADSCEEQNYFNKDQNQIDSDEDIIVDDDINKPIKKPKFDEQYRQIHKNNRGDTPEPQVTSSEETDQQTHRSDDNLLKLQILPENSNIKEILKDNGEYKCFISCLKRTSAVNETFSQLQRSNH